MKETKIQYVYFLKCDNLIKIGTTQNLDKRKRQLAVGNGKEMKFIYAVLGGKDVEYGFHLRFRDDSVRGEWFIAKNIEKWIKRDIMTKQIMIEEGII